MPIRLISFAHCAPSFLIAFALIATGCQDRVTDQFATVQAQIQSTRAGEGGRSDSFEEELPSAALTASTAPLVQVAHNGDKPAASKLYNDAVACVRGARAKEFLVRKSREPGSWVNSPQKMDEFSPEQLALVQEQTKQAQNFDESCTGSYDMIESGELYDIARMAADSGDLSAGFCYASGTLPRPQSWDQDASKYAEYRQNAVRYMQAGMQAGDWRSVALALEASGGRSHGWIRSLIGPNQEIAYELTRLQWLGADPASAAILEQQLQVRARDLSPQAVIAAERRAETTFQKYFANAPPYRSDIVVCPI